MTKAINWPAEFLNDVINENDRDIKVALRLGTIYFDHCYYVPDEIVDIRVNHKIIRQGVIVDNLKTCKISELSTEDLEKYKPGLNSMDAVINFLANTYTQQVDSNTVITVVYYKNLGTETINSKVDDPHM